MLLLRNAPLTARSAPRELDATAPRLWRLVLAESPFLILAGLYVGLSPLAMLALGLGSGATHGWFQYDSAAQALAATIAATVAVRAARRIRDPSAPSAAELFVPERLAGAALCLGLIPPLMNTFVRWKTVIPQVRPFGAWDPAFADWDRALHGGVDPWVTAHRLVPPGASAVVDWLYFPGWPLVMLFAAAWAAWGAEARLRRRFFLSYALTWIVLGTAAALLFSSVGPCYYGFVVPGEDPFAPLMGRLPSLAPRAVRIQQGLWEPIAAGTPGLGVGVSAMPSLHVGGAVLAALFASRVHRALGALAVLFAVAVQFGSVYLGWHYALDGYVSAAAVCGIWWVSGRIEGVAGGRRPLR